MGRGEEGQGWGLKGEVSESRSDPHFLCCEEILEPETGFELTDREVIPASRNRLDSSFDSFKSCPVPCTSADWNESSGSRTLARVECPANG